MKYLLPGILVMFLVIIVGAGAFLLGKQTLSPNTTTLSITPTVQTPKSDSSKIEDITPTQTQQKEVIAGGVLSFPKYTVLLPENWASEREQGQDMDKLTLTKLGYKITISEGAFGGSGCLYPGDPPSEMAQTFTSFVEINNPNGYIFRRSTSGPNAYTICQKGTEGSFGAPTIFGHISFTTPGTPDKNGVIFPEADAILSSIKAQ